MTKLTFFGGLFNMGNRESLSREVAEYSLADAARAVVNPDARRLAGAALAIYDQGGYRSADEASIVEPVEHTVEEVAMAAGATVLGHE
jgi:hypothetical protein